MVPCPAAPTGNRRFTPTAFTLIELLVVIVIIAVLVSISFPVFNSVLIKARKTDTLATINSVRTGLIAYQTEYSDWPPALIATSSNGSDARLDASTNFTSPGVWRDVYYTLTATGETNFLATNNKRRIVFVEFSPKQLSDKSNPANSTTFLDPWGREFNIVLDANGDNRIDNIPNVTAGSGNMSINGSMAIWSFGPDPAKMKDYVTSWK